MSHNKNVEDSSSSKRLNSENLYYEMNVKITFACTCSLYRIHGSPIHACTVNHLEMRVRVACGHAGLARVYSDILIYLYTWSRQNFCKRL